MLHFHVKTDDDSRWTVDWKNEHPFLRLNQAGSSVQLPGTPTRIKTSELRQRHRLIILGERKCGVGAALRWMFDACNQSGVPAVFVDTDTDVPAWSSSFPADLKAEAAAIIAGPLHDAPLHLLRSLECPPGAHRLTMLIRLREVVDGDSARLLAAKLRSLCEPEDSRIDFVIGGSQFEHLEDSLYHSGLTAVSTVLRIAPFEIDVIRALCERVSCSLSEEAAIRLADLTGRHPFLLDSALTQLRAARQTGDPIQLIKGIHDTLRRSPPPGVEMWQKQLASLLVRFPELLPRMRAYVEGTSLAVSDPANFPPPTIERHLYAAGWVGLDRTEHRWGIRSPLHGVWARPVLDQVKERP